MSGTARIRSLVKGAGQDVLVRAGFGRLGRWVRRHDALILAYHNVVPDELVGEGEASLHLGLSAFRRQVELVRRECRPISLVDLLSGEWADGRKGLAVVFTFDDAYRGTVSLALPELARQGVPATVFVAPGILGDRTLWWDALADPDYQGVLPDLRTRILEEGRGTYEGASTVAARRGANWREMPEVLRTVSEQEALELQRFPGVSVGSHSWGHPSLVALPDDELSAELRRPRVWLQERFGEAYVNAVAYPYGHHSPRVEQASRDAGYDAGLNLRGGVLDGSETTDRFRMARNNIPRGLSLDGLSLRLGGVR